MSKLVGKKAEIIVKESWMYGEWGTIVDVDEDGYVYIAMEYNPYLVAQFTRKEIRIMKENKKNEN